MWSTTLTIAVMAAVAHSQYFNPRSGNELVSTIMDSCVDMGCVKQYVLIYLDNLLNIQSDARNIKNIDTAIFKRVARVLKTHEIRFKLPESVFDQTDIVYNPRFGLDLDYTDTDNESRGLGLKKKLLFPLLLLFKLKTKLLMPIFVALIGLKATKALILSKLAIVIVLGFIIYQLLGKSGMPMPLSMSPAPPAEPSSAYGIPGPSTGAPNSYEPGWEGSQGGPYQRIWTPNNDPQSLSYSAYHPGMSISSSSTVHP